MILVAGLGNPGPRYASTRHNLGFMVVDRLAMRAGGAAFREKFHGHYADVEIGSGRVGLLKPATYMNESGRSLQAATAFFKLSLDQVLVVHDEIDLPFGELRFKQGGGDAGNRGVRSVAQALGDGFLRLRIGVGRPPPGFGGDAADFVLEGFASAERTELPGLLDRAADAVVLLITDGVQVAMNATNQRNPR